MRKKLLALDRNGDPYGSGFTASERTVNGWAFRGDIGARSRQWWRNYAKKNGYKLRENSEWNED